MFDLQLWEALETYLKWFAETDGSLLPLSAQLVLIHQRSVLLLFASMALLYSFQVADIFVIRLANMVRFYRAFMRTQQLIICTKPTPVYPICEGFFVIFIGQVSWLRRSS